MSLRNLPAPRALLDLPKGLRWDAPSGAVSAWAGQPLAAEADEAATISVYEAIGEDWWSGEGVTAKRIAGALRGIGANPVTVNINSPGGDMFEGLAIYNLLREHPAEVRVKVMGVAASAASIIAMAGDRIEMGLGSFLMIHNAWGAVVGNRHDMRAAADTFDGFDAAMADIYAARSGLGAEEVAALMDAESFIRAAEAIEKGFADGTFDGPDADPAPGARARAARRRLEGMMAQAGLGSQARRELMAEAVGNEEPAAPPAEAFDLGAAALLLETLRARKGLIP